MNEDETVADATVAFWVEWWRAADVSDDGIADRVEAYRETVRRVMAKEWEEQDWIERHLYCPCEYCAGRLLLYVHRPDDRAIMIARGYDVDGVEKMAKGWQEDARREARRRAGLE